MLWSKSQGKANFFLLYKKNTSQYKWNCIPPILNYATQILEAQNCSTACTQIPTDSKGSNLRLYCSRLPPNNSERLFYKTPTASSTCFSVFLFAKAFSPCFPKITNKLIKCDMVHWLISHWVDSQHTWKHLVAHRCVLLPSKAPQHSFVPTCLRLHWP